MKRRVKAKKKVVGSIGLLTAAVCCFGVASADSTKSGNLYGDGVVRVYAETAEESNATVSWNNAITVLKDLEAKWQEYEAGNGEFSQRDYNDYITNYKFATNALTNISDKTAIKEDVDGIYQVAYGRVGKTVRCLEYFSTTLIPKVATNAIRWSDKKEWDEIGDLINYDLDSFGINQLELEVDGLKDYVTKASEEFDRIQSAMDAVIDAIANIEYVGLVDSKPSLDAVDSAITAVYGIAYGDISQKEIAAMDEYVMTLSDYDKALADYNAIVTECEEFDARIVETHQSFTVEGNDNYLKYYTKRNTIETLQNDYVALNKGEHNDYTTLITESAKIEELVDALDSTLEVKAVVEAKIALIPVTFDYTDEYIELVSEARKAFDEQLPEDLKSVASTDIEGYDVLIKAEADIKECKDKVQELIEQAKNLEVLYNEGSASFKDQVAEVVSKRSEFKLTYPKMAEEFNEECGALLLDMQTKVTKLSGTVDPVKDAIDAIGEVNLKTNPDVGTLIETARNLYDALETDLERNAVSNYDDLTEKEKLFSELMTAASEWKVAVEKIVIGEKVTFQNVLDINAVENTFNNDFDADMQYVIAHTTTYGYEAYQKLLSIRTELFEKISELANAMTALSNEITDIMSGDPVEFNNAVSVATTNLSAFDESIKEEYFVKEGAENKDAYDNYLVALGLSERIVDLVANIIALGDGTGVTMNDYANINDYLADYETLSPDDKLIVDNGGYKEILDTAKSTVDALKVDRDAWIESVNALSGDVAKENWVTDLYSVDTDEITKIENERVQFNLVGDDVYLAQADEDLLVIKEIANGRVQTLNDKIKELYDNQPLNKDDIATLIEIENTYKNKLHKTQQDDVDYTTFEELYNKYVFAQNFDQAIAALYEDVITNGNYTTGVPATIGILRSIYVNFGQEMKELIQRYDDIQEIENAYNEHVAVDGGVLNLTDVYKELAGKIAANSSVGEDLTTQITEVAEKLVGIENAYKESDEQLKLALESAYKTGDEKLATDIKTLQDNLNELKSTLENADSEIIADIAKVREELAGVKSELNGVINEVKEELKAEISALEGKLATAESALKDADGKLAEDIESLQGSLATLKSTLENADSEIIADIAKVREELAGVKSELNGVINEVKEELKAEISTLEDKLNQAKEQLEKADADDKAEIKSSIAQLEQALNDAKSALESSDKELSDKISELENALDNLKAQLEKADADNKATLTNQLNELKKSLKTVTIILSIVSGLSILGIVLVGVLKKKN